MMITHPAFLFHLPFLLTKPLTQKQIRTIEIEVLKWDNTSTGIHKMGGLGFYFHNKEFAHIHWNGNLDIVFGDKLTLKLLKQNHAQQHKYVPNIAITFKLNVASDISKAVFLLRLAHLKAVKKTLNSNNETIKLEMELDKLPFNSVITALV